ncbi:VCBS repeat-containing protein [Singulisphaera sp. GP187]|uniref:Ig-like domain-containing protein n=1 Tax=Singulisphaera sp. GP187 TaxID=1882752 RepID=UPI00092CB7C6|nr:Ig-like domain-containing protein [Singulisphaera sp. GP187]SIN79215.1 VCBS repeat-containing protein [Singulisphaera sp. GP187]
MGTATVNQRLAPGDFSDSGASWRGLGIYTVTGDSLSVRLTDLADGYVIADAMLLERVEGARAEVFDGPTRVADGMGKSNFGVTAIGQSLVKTFTVRNSGTADLHLTGPIALPTGFSLEANFGATTLAPGASTTFAIRYGAATAMASGEIAFDTDDAVQGRYSFNVTGATSKGGKVIDDGESGFVATGNWVFVASNYSFRDDFGYGASAGTNGSSTATWTFENLTPGQYLVAATWEPLINRATNAPYTILDGATAVGTATVNQRLAPGDFSDSGASWRGLGIYTVTGNSLSVRLTDLADGYVIADAMLLERVGNVPIAANDSYTIGHDHSLDTSPLASQFGGFTGSRRGVLDNDSTPAGRELTATLVSGPGHGTLGFNGDGTFTYTPNAGYIGVDSFTYRANDGLADSEVATATISVTENAPVAVGDRYSLRHDDTLTITAVDTGDYGPPIPSGVLLNDSDADGDLLTAVLVATVQHGTLALNANGTFTYTPNAGYTGTDTFTYQASDGLQASGVATVTLTVSDQAPTSVDDEYNVGHDRVLTVSAGAGVLANDDQAFHDLLTGTLIAGPYHGSLSFNADGSFTYTPTATFVGDDSFTYKANDGLNDSAVATATIHVMEHAPVSRSDSYTIAHDHALVVNGTGVLANDNDAERDPLTAILVATVQHGTLSLNSNGSFTYTPEAGYWGPDSFTYKANDGTLDGAITTVSIAVTVLAPIARDDLYTISHDHTLTVGVA